MTMAAPQFEAGADTGVLAGAHHVVADFRDELGRGFRRGGHRVIDGGDDLGIAGLTHRWHVR